MTRRIIIWLVLLGIAVLIGWALFKDQLRKVFPALGLGMDCIPVNRERFSTPWLEGRRPSGELYQIANQYLEGDPGLNGSIVGGFFKAIDVYPNLSRAAFYKEQIQEYARRVRLPWWEVIKGELACDGGSGLQDPTIASIPSPQTGVDNKVPAVFPPELFTGQQHF